MNNKIIFDASAVIGLFAKEKGFEVIKKHLRNAIISSINASEVYKYCIDKQKFNE
jgi:PIN domain nuclease of toxin-antitoxin system